MSKTLYLWDMAGTLFHEKWDSEKTGFLTVSLWIASHLNKNEADVTDREFEEAHEIPYKEGWYFQLALQPGYKEVLSYTKHNETFTTGTKEQINWRAVYLNPRVGFDIRKYINKVNSTFDYSDTNKKTKEMLVSYLLSKYDQGYDTIVYTDDRLVNCQFFDQAAKQIKQKYKDFYFRLYHILNDNKGIRKHGEYWEIGSLSDIITNEKSINN